MGLLRVIRRLLHRAPSPGRLVEWDWSRFGEPLAPVRTPLLDRIERRPAAGVVRDWGPQQTAWEGARDRLAERVLAECSRDGHPRKGVLRRAVEEMR